VNDRFQALKLIVWNSTLGRKLRRPQAGCCHSTSTTGLFRGAKTGSSPVRISS